MLFIYVLIVEQKFKETKFEYNSFTHAQQIQIVVLIEIARVYKLPLPTARCGPWLRHCASAHAPGALNVSQPGMVLAQGAQNHPHVILI